jgi:hypothetical protein
VCAALLAAPLLPAPAARADGLHECFSGGRTPIESGYDINAQGCFGWGLSVLIRFGPAAGTYDCSSVFSWNGFLSGRWCRLRTSP